MDFWTYFCCLLALLTSQILALNLRYKQPSEVEFMPDSKALKILQLEWKKPSLNSQLTKEFEEDRYELAVDEQKISPHARKSLRLKPGHSTWWPSEADYSDAFNEILESSSEPPRLGVKKTFEELENENANIYNPLLNLDHYPIPSKKYTFEELENMNANQYNPLLN